MASTVSEQLGLWRLISSVSVSTGAIPGGDSIDMRPFSQGAIYATSTFGTPTITYWMAATTTGPFRLLKTSTGGAVSQVMAANAANRMPAAVSGAQFIKLSSSTTAAPKTLPFVFLKK